MKLIYSTLTALLIVVFLFGALSEVTVYADFYPIYAVLSLLTKDVPEIDLHCLIQPQDSCFRNYSLSDWDYALLEASAADAVFIGGSGLESFENIFYSMGADGPAVCSLYCNAELFDRSVNGISPDAESHWNGAIPYAYLSLNNFKAMCESACGYMTVLCPERKQSFYSNLLAGLEKADDALKEIDTVVSAVRGTSVILMNEALVYIADEYCLEIAYAVDRESGDNCYGDELNALIQKLQECGANDILIEKQAPQHLIEALESAGFTVCVIDIMSTHSEQEGADGYFDAQYENAHAILSIAV